MKPVKSEYPLRQIIDQRPKHDGFEPLPLHLPLEPHPRRPENSRGAEESETPSQRGVWSIDL